MQLKINKVTKSSLTKLYNSLMKLSVNRFEIKDLDDNIQMDGVIAFLHHLKHRNPYLLDALVEAGLIDDEVATTSQLRMKTIAKNDQLEILINKEKIRGWADSKLFRQFMFATYGFSDGNIQYVLKKTYNKHKRNIVEKLARIKTNKDVLQLAQKHPDIDIPRLVSYGVVSDKIDYTKDDLIWLDKMIDIIKQGNK